MSKNYYHKKKVVPELEPEPKLFESEIVSSWRVPLKCSNCDLLFASPVHHRPYLNGCKHNLCEKCAFANKNLVICQICNHQQNPKDLEVNFYLYGVLWYQHHDMKYDEGRYRRETTNESKEFLKSIACAECSNNEATLYCEQCTHSFCNHCYDKIHKTSKVLMKHRFKVFHLEKKVFTKAILKCKQHKTICEKFCNSCMECICALCENDSHFEHSINTLYNENLNYIVKVNEAIEVTGTRMQICRQSLQVTKSVDQSLETYAKKSINDINGYFLNLHCVLQIIERDLLLSLKNKIKPRLKEVRKAIVELDNSNKMLNKAQSHLDEVYRNVPTDQHLKGIVKQVLNVVKDLPCQVNLHEFAQNPLSIKLPEFSQKFEDKIINSIKDNLPPGEMAEVVQSPVDLDISRSDSNILADYSLEAGFAEPIDSREITRNDVELVSEVVITEVISPELIYAIPMSIDQHSFKEKCRRLADHSKMPEHFEVNDFVLGFNEMDGFWYRCVILERHEHLKFKARLLDYGTTQFFRKNNLRALKNEGLKEEFFCFTCKLFDIEPNGEQWSDQCKNFIIEMIDKKPTRMVVKSGTKGKTLIVDFISKAGYSIRNALICSKYGREVPSPRSACNDMFHKLRSQFISKNTLRFFSGSYNSMDVFQAQCLNVKDPYNFYIIKEENKLSLDNLTSEMEEYFNKIRPRHLYSIEIDLPCTLKPDGAWARGKIIRFDDDIIIVKLVDEGRILPTKWSELYELPEEFLKLNESAIECSLIHVEPLDGFGAQWDRASVEEFKKITTGGYFEVKIVEKSRSTYKIILVSVQNQLNINALFCAQGFANSTGKHSAVDILPEKLKTTSRDIVEAKMDLVPKRSNIIISHYCNPGEFYLQCESHLVKIAEFQKNIHSEMNILRQMKKVVRIEKPEVGDMCMVHDKLDSKPMKQWFRAQFKTKVEAKYCVFLVDYGNILYTSKVFEIPSAFESVARGAVKCHLACIKPTGNLSEWPACSIDFLRDCTVKYRNLSASKTDSCPCGNSSSTCTFLWGISEESKGALSALQTQWININKELFKEGYAHKTADMLLETFFDYNFNLPIDKSPFEDWKKIELKLKSENTFSDDNHNKVHLEGPIVMKAKLNHYISPKMISKTVFTGYPTYVDHEAIIYLHDDEGKKFIEQINSNVEEFLNSLEWKNHELNNSMNRFSNSEDWEPGQACLARFHFDNKYYRAEIVSLMENDLIQVRFVDYGNVEECGYSDLLGITVYPNVPIQAHKYKFYGIKPVNTQSHHENHVLDTMHKMVVEKICQIRVENKTTSSNSSSTFSYPMSKDDPQFLMCSVKVDNNIDVVDYLLQKEMVECTDSAREKLLYEKKSISGIYNRNEELFNGKGSSANIVNKTDPFDENRDFIIKHEEIQSIFIRQQMEEIVNLSMEDNKSKPNDDVVELDSSYVSRYWERKSKLYKEFGSEDEEEEPSYDCFNPSDTSSSKFNNGIGPYIFRKFHRKHSKFECEVHSVETSTIVSINPLIDEFINEFVKVQKSIAEVVGRTPLLEGLKKGQACLARHLDGKWYRGYIESVPQPGLYAKVILVDIMSLQEISREYLKVIPASFLNIPLRCSRVELSGVQPNGRLRNKLITETLTNILVKDYKTMFAVITNYNSRYPKVKLYTDETCTTLVYHQMILDQMFNI